VEIKLSTVSIQAQRAFRKGRPNYPMAFKRQVAAAVNEPGVSVASVALAHGLNTNMVFKWRREFRAGLFTANKSEPALLPITVVHSNTALDISTVNVIKASMPKTSALSAPRPRGKVASGFIDIELNGARIRVHGTVESEQLRCVLQCLSGPVDAA
jgi:transposase